MDPVLTAKSAAATAAAGMYGIEEIRASNLAVRLAATPEEIHAAQKLRYRIFYEEMGGAPSAEVRNQKRDFDVFDDYCDHLLVIDSALPAPDSVVGTYRLLRRSSMEKLGRFYSEGEFDISIIKREKGEILELGRSCVDAAYRSRAVMQLLWRGIAAYVTQYDVKLMFGCASFPGIDVKSHEKALSYLYHYHLAPPAMRATALAEQHVEMNLMPKESLDAKEAFATLPALIKGYLRVGGHIGDGAVIDALCNTLDVSVVVKTDMLTGKYAQRYAVASAKNEE